MKNSWQMQAGPLLLRPETNLSKYQKKATWPFIRLRLFFSQGKDVLSFLVFWVFKRKRLINQSFSLMIDTNEVKKCRTRTEHFTWKFLQKNDKAKTIGQLPVKDKLVNKIERGERGNFSNSWLKSFLLIGLILIQLPLIEKSWKEEREREKSKIVQEKKETVYFSLPKEINFSQKSLIEINEDKIVVQIFNKEATDSAKLTQIDKTNLALASFYKNDWSNYQAWLNDAKAMDPNETIFK